MYDNFIHGTTRVPLARIPARLFLLIVITGFNTDIEYQGVIYHVQTEDKGLERPMILSLVYNGGTILASKRASYDDLVAGGFDEKQLEERLNRQHRLICAAIKAGRIDDLKKMSSRETVPARSAEPAIAETLRKAETVTVSLELPDVPEYPVPRPETGELSFPIPRPDFGEEFDLDSVMEGPVIDIGAISIIEEEAIEEVVLPETAVEIISDMAGKERPVNDKLSVELLGDVKFKGGERRAVTVMVCRGSERKIVPDVQIMIKIIGSNFRPLIFHSATDDNGIASVNMQFPKFRSGRAALLVRASDGGDEVELRRPVELG
ncbi:MAG: hypothetical protein KF685_03575 [Acidobacteria bacterium]|nr:hypothetical protein [Acidobacteriota bacterium]